MASIHFKSFFCNFGMPFGQPLAPVPFSAIDSSVKGEFFSPSGKVRLKTSVVRHNIFTCSGMHSDYSFPLSMLLILIAAKHLLTLSFQELLTI